MTQAEIERILKKLDEILFSISEMKAQMAAERVRVRNLEKLYEKLFEDMTEIKKKFYIAMGATVVIISLINMALNFV